MKRPVYKCEENVLLKGKNFLDALKVKHVPYHIHMHMYHGGFL
jgi:hypothetical protein